VRYNMRFKREKRVMPQVPKCEDCGDEIEKGRRRVRCPHCKKLVCSYCYNHAHGLVQAMPSTECH